MTKSNLPQSIKNNQSKKTAINHGDRFGRLTVIEETDRHMHPSGQFHRKFKCLCDCGNVSEVLLQSLTSGQTKSCGCLSSEAVTKRNTIHSKSKTHEYNIWYGIKRRCLDTNNPAYKNYGGRGIAICKRWLIFQNFFDDMGYRPSLKHSIERIDNEGNYELQNCVWIPRRDQPKNTRRCNYITYDGITDLQSGWDKRLGLSVGIIASRMRKGMTGMQAITYKKEIREFIVCDASTNKFIGKWDNQTRCAEYLGINNREVCDVLSGRRNMTHGYKMKYIKTT